MDTTEPVKVFLDHSKLLYFKTEKYLSPKQARWALFLDKFNMVIYNIAGKKRKADAPSRQEDYTDGSSLIPEAQNLLKHMAIEELVKVKGSVLNCHESFHELSFQKARKDMIDYLLRKYTDDYLQLPEIRKQDGVVWFKDCIFLPEALRVRLMKQYHDSPTAGHPGVARTLLLIMRTIGWPGLRKLVMDYV